MGMSYEVVVEIVVDESSCSDIQALGIIHILVTSY